MRNYYLAGAMALLISSVGFQSCTDDDDPVAHGVEVAEVKAGGTISVSPAEAKSGETVTLTATVDDKWEFGGWSLMSGDKAVELADPMALQTTFVMPDAPVSVSAKFLAPGEKFGLTTVKIPAGTRMLGSEPTEPSYYKDEKLHEVTLTKDFYMGAYEVTNAQFAAFLNATGVGQDGEGPVDEEGTEVYVYDSTTRDKGDFNFGVVWDGEKWAPAEGYDEHPVIYVSWYGADAYAKWVGGALPTEAQWEYACRGGQEGNLPFGIGDGTKMEKGMAQFYIYDYYDLAKGGRVVDQNVEGYVASTFKVGSFEPNGYGIYDMHGNVYEWVSDWYDSYPEGSLVDPQGPEDGSRKIIRGGGWVNSGRELRSAVRWYVRPTSKLENQGFRVVF